MKFTKPQNYNQDFHKECETAKGEVELAAHLRSQAISGMIP